MESLDIGLDSWIIQDGNYDDFVAGQEAKFALEFHPFSLVRSNCKSFSAIKLKAYRYKICAEIVYSAENVWVLDFGLMAYDDAKPPEFATKGAWVEGEIYLGIDPFTYFESLKKIPEMPTLTYNFKIEKIFLDTAPWLEKLDEMSGRKTRMRDTATESFQEILKTDAWHDDDGSGSYILRCLRI